MRPCSWMLHTRNHTETWNSDYTCSHTGSQTRSYTHAYTSSHTFISIWTRTRACICARIPCIPQTCTQTLDLSWPDHTITLSCTLPIELVLLPEPTLTFEPLGLFLPSRSLPNSSVLPISQLSITATTAFLSPLWQQYQKGPSVFGFGKSQNVTTIWNGCILWYRRRMDHITQPIKYLLLLCDIWIIFWGIWTIPLNYQVMKVCFEQDFNLESDHLVRIEYFRYEKYSTR